MRHNFEEWQFTSPKKNTSACVPKANPTSSAIPIDAARASGTMLLSFSPRPRHYLHRSPLLFLSIHHPATPLPLGNLTFYVHHFCHTKLNSSTSLTAHSTFISSTFSFLLLYTLLDYVSVNIMSEEFLHCFLERKEERKEVVFLHHEDFSRFGGLGYGPRAPISTLTNK